MKELFHTVELKIFEDDNSGIFGLTHLKTFDHDNSSFDPFWDGPGIFHDVFEHWFEFEHEYFMGDNALNVSGECVASGAMLYYTHHMDLAKTRFRKGFYKTPTRIAIDSIQYMLLEHARGENMQFGYTFNSVIPEQRDINDWSDIDQESEELMEEIIEGVKLYQDYNDCEENEKENSDIYMASLTLQKLQDTFRYGLKIAEELIPNNEHNQLELERFINFFKKFCRDNSAEEISYIFDQMVVKVYKEDGNITWHAFLIGDEIGEVELTDSFDIGRVQSDFFNKLDID